MEATPLPKNGDQGRRRGAGRSAARPWLPALLFEMAEAYGLDVALDFARAYGGQYLCLPAVVRADHPVATAFSPVLLAWLIERHARNERIVIPKGPNRDCEQFVNQLRSLLDQSKPASEIARILGRHVRTIHEWKRRLRQGDGQMLARNPKENEL